VSTLIVVPTYNEADNISIVLHRLRHAAPDASVLVVDDNSPDGTGDIVEALQADLGHIHLLRRPGKEGLGPAYRAGFAWGMEHGFQVLVEMDADLSHDPDAVPSLVAALDDADLAIGSRYIPGGSIPGWVWHRRALSRWGNRYAARMLGLSIADATSGFRAYRASILERIDLGGIRADGYGFQIEMVYRTARAFGHIVEVPIAFADRVAGTSKMSGRIIVEALAMVTWVGLRDRYRSLGRRSEVQAPTAPNDASAVGQR
jgi:dolichol-phosphate mannosyltransferase